MSSLNKFEIIEMFDGNQSDFDYFENDDEVDEWDQNEGSYILFF